MNKLSLDFLKNLKDHNNKEWFDTNRKLYESAKKDFLSTYEDLVLAIANFDDRVSTNIENCKKIFRINRDIRFSKDKTPYKTNMGALIYSGAKDSSHPIYYIHLEPGMSGIAIGIYMPETDQLQRIRTYIAKHYLDLEDIVLDRKFGSVWGDMSTDLKLKKTPSGFSDTHPAIELIKLKSFTFWKGLNDSEVSSRDLVERITKDFEVALEFMNFMDRAVAK